MKMPRYHECAALQPWKNCATYLFTNLLVSVSLAASSSMRSNTIHPARRSTRITIISLNLCTKILSTRQSPCSYTDLLAENLKGPETCTRYMWKCLDSGCVDSKGEGLAIIVACKVCNNSVQPAARPHARAPVCSSAHVRLCLPWRHASIRDRSVTVVNTINIKKLLCRFSVRYRQISNVYYNANYIMMIFFI